MYEFVTTGLHIRNNGQMNPNCKKIDTIFLSVHMHTIQLRRCTRNLRRYILSYICTCTQFNYVDAHVIYADSIIYLHMHTIQLLRLDVHQPHVNKFICTYVLSYSSHISTQLCRPTRYILIRYPISTHVHNCTEVH